MSDERRGAPRIRATTPIEVVDCMLGEPVGHIGDLSRTGLMLICQRPLRDGAVYQLQFQLPRPHGRPIEIQIGAHGMWSMPVALDGQQWVGLRIISLGRDAGRALDDWLQQAAE